MIWVKLVFLKSCMHHSFGSKMFLKDTESLQQFFLQFTYLPFFSAKSYALMIILSPLVVSSTLIIKDIWKWNALFIHAFITFFFPAFRIAIFTATQYPWCGIKANSESFQFQTKIFVLRALALIHRLIL